MSMDAQHKIWCDVDEHHLFEHYVAFNEWLDGEDGQELREKYGIDALSQPSKAFYAGDKEAYDQAFLEYRRDRRHEALNESYLKEQFGDGHWFDRNLIHFEQLVSCIKEGGVVPFIGAGVSVSGGFPSWGNHLRQQGRTAGIDSSHIEELLAQGHYEMVIEEIEAKRGRDVFINEIRDVFSRTGSIPDAIWRITEQFNDTVITTNYDRLIEQAYDTGEKDAFQIINGMSALEQPIAGRVSIIKLHGDIKNPELCILSKSQYDDAYGSDKLDMERQIPKLLSYHYRNSTLLFLGCSLNNDRTVEVFRAVKETMSRDVAIPQHFSIEQVPEDESELTDRNEALARLGITAIWFEKEHFEYVERMLELSKNEIGYHGTPQRNDGYDTADAVTKNSASLDIELSEFLRDFVDLMPLMYWLHKHIPQNHTSKYLGAMQRVFHAYSFFIDETDQNLTHGLDNLLRALSNKYQFDGYTYGKLSAAFNYFQRYLKSVGEDNYADDSFEWDYHEMLSISARQFEDLITSMPEDIGLDYHAIRLTIALLRHGRNQLQNQKDFCELPGSVNSEFADYLKHSMSSKLGLVVPDILDEMLSGDIRSLCQNTWRNIDRPFDLSLFSRVRIALSQIILLRRG
jgi:NAD-dependent SIR2 family protein deacetylase